MTAPAGAGEGTGALDDLFLTGAGAALRPASELFVNRVGELDAFRAAYRRVHAPAQPVDPTDLGEPRTNVIMFYGMGGIGKTRLAQQCEALVRAGEAGQEPRPATFRVDLRDPAFLDPEALVVGVRAAVGVQPGVRLPAFDLGLSVYWDTKHPGESLRSFLGRSEWLARATRNPRLYEEIAGTVGDLLGASAIANAGLRIGRRLVTGLAERAQTRSLLARCPRLEQMLATDNADSLRAYLPYLLAWDLAQLPPQRQVAFTVFVDTFEEAQERSRGPGDIEDIVARCAYLMPNVLFVIAGRNRLRWASPGGAGLILFHGPDRWPGLADPGRDMWLLGGLSERDARAYLHGRLAGGGATAAVVDRVVAASGGWPLYLDLQATRLARLHARGAAVDPAELGGGLVEVLVRVLRDLDEWERDLLRAAALVTIVDKGTLRAALPEMRESRIDRFLELSLLTTGAGAANTGRGLNSALRESIREADGMLDDHWSGEQWAAVARRVAEHLGGRLRSADPAVLTAALLDGFQLGARFDIRPGWLALAAERVFGHGSWEVLRTAGSSAQVQGSVLRPVALAAEAAARRAAGDTGGAQRLAAQAAQGLDDLDGELADYVAWQAAASAERSGRRGEAAAYCSRIRTAAFYGRSVVRLGRLAWVGGDLDRAAAYAARALAPAGAAAAPSAAPDGALGQPVVTARSLAGWVRLTQGRFDEATGAFQAALDAARSTGDRFFVSSELSHLALAGVLAAPGEAGEVVRQALREADTVGAVRQLAQARTADAVLRAAGGEVDGALGRLGTVMQLLEGAGDQVELRLPLLALVVVLARAGRTGDAVRRAGELREFARRHDAHACLAVVGGWLAGEPDAERHFPGLRWGDDPATVRDRWLRVVG
ncbi:MAG TPA: hypothetical protein VFM55_15700 [Micromonosporaceae bacterium]|nr:hypothetical protein [Micromonosporaceae bacterium]